MSPDGHPHHSGPHAHERHLYRDYLETLRTHLDNLGTPVGPAVDDPHTGPTLVLNSPNGHPDRRLWCERRDDKVWMRWSNTQPGLEVLGRADFPREVATLVHVFLRPERSGRRNRQKRDG